MYYYFNFSFIFYVESLQENIPLYFYSSHNLHSSRNANNKLHLDLSVFALNTAPSKTTYILERTTASSTYSEKRLQSQLFGNGCNTDAPTFSYMGHSPSLTIQFEKQETQLINPWRLANSQNEVVKVKVT